MSEPIQGRFPRLFAFFGASGSGKSTALTLLRERYGIATIRKQTTRPPRDEDGDEVECVEELAPDLDVRYTGYGTDYGFRASDVWQAFHQHENAAVIVNDIRTLRVLRRKFGSLLRTVYVHSGINREQVESLVRRRYKQNRLTELRLNQEIERRVHKIETVHRKYIENVTLFDRTILNVGSIDELEGQLANLVRQVEGASNRHRTAAKVFLIAGGEMSGKDDLVSALQQMDRRLQLYCKATNRPERDGDRGELRHMAEVDPSKYDVIYGAQGFEYGISSEEVWGGLAEGRAQLIVVSDSAAIRSLVRVFGTVCTVIFLHARFELSEIVANLEKKGYPEPEIELRLDRHKSLFKLYTEETTMFDHVLLNTAQKEDLYDQAFNLVDHYFAAL